VYFYKSIFVSFILLACCLFIGPDQQEFTIHGLAQGTDYQIRYFATSATVTKKNVDSILLKIDSSMSLYKDYSLISQFNRSEKGIMLDAHFETVIKKSFQINKDTKGLFDVTVAPLVQLWGFGPAAIESYPDSGTVKRTLENVGMKYLTLIGSDLTKKKPLVKIDLNGIAQGYSVDVVAGYLNEMGIKSFIVEIGGEVFVKGYKPGGGHYKIGIEGPAEDGQEASGFKHIVSLTEGAITTSGNYRKTLQYKHRKISHLINPLTGYPLENQMVSVTVYAKDAITADGYDNALMAMSPTKVLKFLKSRKDMEAYIIYRQADGSIRDTLTAGFKKLIIN
jgi:thiamine biosynthesis lipoprotein